MLRSNKNTTNSSTMAMPSIGKSKQRAPFSATVILLLMTTNGVSFFLGTLFAFNAGTVGQSQSQSQCTPQQQAAKPLQKTDQNDNKQILFPPGVQRFAVGMAHTKKEDFTNNFELGVPLDLPKEGEEDVLLLYSKQGAMPKQMTKDTTSIDHYSTKEAVENCDFLNVIFTFHGGDRNQCLAIVPQYESFHIQKWMRVPPDGQHGKLDHSHPLRLVSRGYQSNGREQFPPPKEIDTRSNWDMLQNYLKAIDDVLAELKPIVEQIAIQNTIIVMVVNFGQSELLLNFACAARSRNLDTSNVLVFATDLEAKQLAESVGLTAYFDERNFGNIPMEAAGRYGDRKFVAMMMAKVICVQVISMLKKDILFQDVDIVWYKNPLEYFHDKSSPLQVYDVLFQDDGAHSTRYAPYSANSGFYYVRYNDRTQYFLTSLLMSGDLVLKTDSHQQAMVAILSEHASLYGLRVKVLSRDEDEFPGGFHFHQKSGNYMRAFFNGEKDPYIFHMSWTKNKDNKLLFLRQMGEWYVNDKCIDKKLDEIALEDNNFVDTCCYEKAQFSCHYRDKPSIKPCKDSPPIDEGKKSFW